MKTIKKNRVREPVGDRIFTAVQMVTLIFALAVTAFPLIFVLSASVSDPTAIYRGQVWLWPVGLNFEGYRRVLMDPEVLSGYWNAIVFTFWFVILTLFATMPCAYALSRKDFVGRKILMGFFVLTMFLSGGLIPFVLVVRGLGLMNSMWAVILPGIVNAFNIIIARTFFQATIPDELLEAAQIDGCSNTRFFLSVVLPLAKPILAVIGLFAAVQMWNQWFNSMLFIDDRARLPLQNILRDILIMADVNTSMVRDMAAIAEMQRVSEIIRYALIVVATVPMMILYPFVQKHFVKGVMIGSIKG